MTTNDTIDYPTLINAAFRGVICDALKVIEANPIPERFWLYITFNTNNEDVNIPAWLKGQHPDSLTIVLQNQYNDLVVTDEGFGVTLYFGGKSAFLSIPFESIITFNDVHSNFNFCFKQEEMEKHTKEETEAKPEPKNEGTVISLDKYRKEKTNGKD